MLTGNLNRKAGSRIMVLLVILCVIFSAFPVFAASGTDNMLTNPEWESGTDGWVIQANNADGVFDGESIVYSRVYQDVPLSEPEDGQMLVLGANLQTDPSQMNIEIGLIICKSDGSYITEPASYRCDGFILDDGSLWTLGTEYLGGGETVVYTGEPVYVTDNVLSVSVSDSNGAVIKTDRTLWTGGYYPHVFSSDEPVQLFK